MSALIAAGWAAGMVAWPRVMGAAARRARTRALARGESLASANSRRDALAFMHGVVLAPVWPASALILAHQSLTAGRRSVRQGRQ